MPRDATDTRERLLREAEKVFATRGIYEANLREIVLQAGQRNTSAISYHFGSRNGMLQAILDNHGAPLDHARGLYRSRLEDAPTTRSLVAALLLPYADALSSAQGRDYLRIVAQLSERFPSWRGDASAPHGQNTPHLHAILDALESRPLTVPIAVRRERLVQVIMLMTSAMAHRAQAIDTQHAMELGHEAFLANLADTITAVLEAPIGPLLHLGEREPFGA